jgi:hypothetical protein
MNYEQNVARKDVTSYVALGEYCGTSSCTDYFGNKHRTMGNFYGNECTGFKECTQQPGLENLTKNTRDVRENYDSANCSIVVPTEASMSYGKIFNVVPNARSYRGYYSVTDGYSPAQSDCGQYRLRKCL